MISCERFRKSFAPGTESPALLEHLRSCDPCLDFAAEADPDVMFRALGGQEMIPPGGIEAFVDDVMQQVRVREAEQVATPARVLSWPRRLAVAAAVAAAVTGATFVYRIGTPTSAVPTVVAQKQTARVAPLTTRPIIESYESDNATIVEVPTDDVSDDTKIVMIFDESLPADL